MRRKESVIGALMVVAAMTLAASASAEEDVPLVDGVMWKETAPVLKQSYLVGLSNLLSVEYMYQQEFGPPPDKQTTIQRLWEAIDDVSLDGAVERIDAWYEAHPDKLSTSVLAVIWLDMVRPNLPASRRYHPDGPIQEEK